MNIYNHHEVRFAVTNSRDEACLGMNGVPRLECQNVWATGHIIVSQTFEARDERRRRTDVRMLNNLLCVLYVPTEQCCSEGHLVLLASTMALNAHSSPADAFEKRHSFECF